MGNERQGTEHLAGAHPDRGNMHRSHGRGRGRGHSFLLQAEAAASVMAQVFRNPPWNSQLLEFMKIMLSGGTPSPLPTLDSCQIFNLDKGSVKI